MPKTIGNFYFKLTDTGNLIGEYSNKGTPKGRPESALRDDQDKGIGFAGKYISTWFEPTNAPNRGDCLAAELKITQNLAPSDLFVLEWTPLPGSSTSYQGSAMLCGGVLVGNYQSV
jgi:hypothetical protein